MSQFGIKRLQKEYSNLVKSSKNQVYAKPLESNIFIWNYILLGNQEPYTNGYYHGTLTFPSEYPMKPPSIKMITPNGRFETNTPICMSMSDFHPETWNPSWSIESILHGLYSFMLEDVITTGGIDNTVEQRKRLAIESYHFNKTNPVFMDLLEEMNSNKSTQYDIIDNIKPSCRYCLMSDNKLIKPCSCKGTNQWVHLECLKKWQKTAILSQSTHPKYQTNIETICNVCQQPFNFKTINREELMIQYTGEEIVNMINIGYFIVSSKQSSTHNMEIMEKYPEIKQNLLHWTNAIYLIIKDDNDSILGIDLTRPTNITNGVIYSIDNNTISIKNIWDKYGTNIIEKLVDTPIEYYIGGPCVPEHIVAIFELNSIDYPSTGIYHLYGNIYYSNFTTIFSMNIRLKTLKLYFGFAGWGKTQLIGEIAKGSWGMCYSERFNINNYRPIIWDEVVDSNYVMYAPNNEFQIVISSTNN